MAMEVERFRIVPDPSAKGRRRYEPVGVAGLVAKGGFPTADAARKAFERDCRKARSTGEAGRKGVR